MISLETYTEEKVNPYLVLDCKGSASRYFFQRGYFCIIAS